MEAANHGHVSGYGDDPWTAAAADAFREMFETECEVFFAFNGTAANSLVLASLCQSYHAVICCQSAHVETDECGAPEFFSNGSKLLIAESDDGKLTPAAVHMIATNRTGHSLPQASRRHHQPIHGNRPRLHRRGTARSLAGVPETRSAAAHGWSALRQCLRQPWLLARGTYLEERSRRALLRRHEERNGGRRSDSLLRSETRARLRLPLQAGGQLASKMRFLAAPWVGMLESGAWLSNAAHANECARYLAEQLSGIPGVQIVAHAGGERGVRPCFGRNARGSAPTGVEVLYLYRRRRAIHVLMGYGSQTYRRILPRRAHLCRAGLDADEMIRKHVFRQYPHRLVILRRCAQDDESVQRLTERGPLCGSRGALQVPRLRSG